VARDKRGGGRRKWPRKTERGPRRNSSLKMSREKSMGKKGAKFL
jgi:hypothetical protein